MTPVLLMQPHLHAGVPYRPGDRLDVDDLTAAWLLANGVATPVVVTATADPDSKFSPRQEAKR